MKKIMSFVLFILALSVGTIVYAEEVQSIIGKKVEGSFPLIINGQKSEKDVIVIDGTSYIPVRASGEIFGYDVSFIDSEVILNRKKVSTEMDQATKDKLDKWEQDRQASFDQIKDEEERAAKIRAEGDAEMQMIKDELERRAKEEAQKEVK